MNLLPLLLVLAQQQPLAGLDPYITQAIKDWRVPGLAIVVVKDDSVVFMKGYGVRELGKPDPVTVHTRFGNMSTTKAFTASRNTSRRCSSPIRTSRARSRSATC